MAMRFVSRIVAFCVLSYIAGCADGIAQVSPNESVAGWLHEMRTRAPVELRIGESELSGQCQVPEFPDPTRTWADALVRREITEVVSAHDSLGALPSWVFGPWHQVPETDDDRPLLFAAGLWSGEAEILCGGEPATAALVLVSAAEPIERLGVLDQGELRSQMAANVEEYGLADVLDVDFSRPICPDTEEGCGG